MRILLLALALAVTGCSGDSSTSPKALTVNDWVGNWKAVTVNGQSLPQLSGTQRLDSAFVIFATSPAPSGSSGWAQRYWYENGSIGGLLVEGPFTIGGDSLTFVFANSGGTGPIRFTYRHTATRITTTETSCPTGGCLGGAFEFRKR